MAKPPSNENKKMPCNVKDWTLCLLALSIVWGFLAFGLIIIFGWGTPLDPKDRLMLIQQIVNFTWGGAGMVIGYYFGASKSNEEKSGPGVTVKDSGPVSVTNQPSEKAPATTS